jgi:hypothetical protein
MKAVGLKRLAALAVLMMAPRSLADRLCHSEAFVRWLDPRGWLVL